MSLFIGCSDSIVTFIQIYIDVSINLTEMSARSELPFEGRNFLVRVSMRLDVVEVVIEELIVSF